jgi:phosphopantothenoylcysteine synthetase/decarboxylase
VPPDQVLTLEGEEARSAERLLERAAVSPILADAGDGFGGLLVEALRVNGVLVAAQNVERPARRLSIRKGPINVVFGITGGVDAVRAPSYLAVLSEQEDLEATVVLTSAAARFVNPDGLRWYSGMRVATDLFGGKTADHAVLGQWADVVAVVPATAEFMCRLASGGYSDLLSATIAMASGAVVLAPSMNERMWRRQAVRRAVRSLSEEGFEIVLPASGTEVSGGTRGFGGVGVGPFELPLLIRLLARVQRGRSVEESEPS